MIPPIHPFPARMAPDLALATLRDLPESSFVLDPMAGSGTVLRHAGELGHHALGLDSDPLAVLMSRVWTTPVRDDVIVALASSVVDEARALKIAEINLNWIDDDKETSRFVRYWFGLRQRRELRQIACVLHNLKNRSLTKQEEAAADVLRIALSRIIITKDQGASLGRDISHSRPHRVASSSDYQVIPNFTRSIATVRRRLIEYPPTKRAHVMLGDARDLSAIASKSVDAVLTSPPYLNAIDYMRGHRLSLVWLGHSLGSLREVRSGSIGAERGEDVKDGKHYLDAMKRAMGQIDLLPRRHQRIINRYVGDLYTAVGEISRVLRKGGRATFVMGDSCLKDVFVHNSHAIRAAAEWVGLEFVKRRGRILPTRSRYLPISDQGTLAKRIRTEMVLTFARV